MDCPDTCSWVVTVKDGRAVKLQGDPTHPFTRGVLCNKLDDYVAYTQSPERLLYPMRRVGPKGAGDFERISWDGALDEIAERLGRVIREFGAEAIWPYLGSGSMGLLQGCYGAGRRLWNVVGASQHVMTICTIAGGVGTGYTLGDNRVGMDPETLRFSKLDHPVGQQHADHQPSPVARHHDRTSERRPPGRRSTRPGRAPPRPRDSHLAPIPGPTPRWRSGLLHVVLAEGAEDRDFIDRPHARLGRLPPPHPGLPAGARRRDLRPPGRRDRGAGEADRPHAPHGHPGDDGAPAHGGGGMAVRTITCIPGVTGDWRYPGGGAGYDTRGFFGVNWAGL